jgi:hypothetical protein
MLTLKQTIHEQWTAFIKAGFVQKCSTISFACLCLFLFDCCIFGGGHYLHVGPITPRMLFGLASLLFALPELFKNIRTYLKNPAILLTAAFVIYLLISAVRGYLAQNNMSVLASDLKGFFWLFLVPVFIAVVRSKRKLHFLLDVIIVGATVQALYVFAVNVICVLVPDGLMILYDWMIYDSQMGFVNIISSTIFRVFMKSCPYMAFACAIAVFRQIKSKKINWYYMTAQVLCMNALFFSFTRSVYGCLIIVLLAVVVLALIFCRRHIKRILAVLLLSAVMMVGFIGLQELALGGNYLNYGIARTFNLKPRISYTVKLHNLIFYGDSSLIKPGPTMPDDQELKDQQAALDQTVDSDALRALTTSELKELFVKSPLIGNGLGAVAPSRNGPDEYFYFDVLARMGIVGLILYVAPFAYLCLWMLRKRSQLSDTPYAWAALCGLIGFWVITWFNPWMNAVLGISAYALCLSLPNLLTNNIYNNDSMEDAK